MTLELDVVARERREARKQVLEEERERLEPVIAAAHAWLEYEFGQGVRPCYDEDRRAGELFDALAALHPDQSKEER